MTEAPRVLKIVNGWKIFRLFRRGTNVWCEAECPTCHQTRERQYSGVQSSGRCRDCYREGKEARKASTCGEEKKSHGKKYELAKKGAAEEEQDSAGLLPAPKRPSCRAECVSVPRPCPFVSCKHNTFLEVTRAGTLQFATRYTEIEDVPPHLSCVLDIVEQGGDHTLEQVGTLFALTRERIRQVERMALEHLQKNLARQPRLREELFDSLRSGGGDIRPDRGMLTTRTEAKDWSASPSSTGLLSWDQWREQQENQNELSVATHTRMLRGRVHAEDRRLSAHVPSSLADGDASDAERSLSNVGAETAQPQPGERGATHPGEAEGQKRSEAEGEEIDVTQLPPPPDPIRRPNARAKGDRSRSRLSSMQRAGDASPEQAGPLREPLSVALAGEPELSRSGSEESAASSAPIVGAGESVAIDDPRDSTGPVGELHLLQDNDAGAALDDSLVPQASDAGEPTALSGDGDAVVPLRPKVGDFLSTRHKHSGWPKQNGRSPELVSNRGRLLYALDHYSALQLDRLVGELAHSPHNEDLQDALRTRLAKHLYAGENQQAKRTQRALGILCDQQQKDRTINEQQQAAKLLEMIATNPTKIDLIEGLAKKAGWIVAPGAVAFDRDIKPEKETPTKAPKKTSAAEGKDAKGASPSRGGKRPGTLQEGRRHLTDEEIETLREMNKRMTWKVMAGAVGSPEASIFSALKKRGGLPVGTIEALMKLSRVPSQEAAE